jgi:hypothetical protein
MFRSFDKVQAHIENFKHPNYFGHSIPRDLEYFGCCFRVIVPVDKTFIFKSRPGRKIEVDLIYANP